VIVSFTEVRRAARLRIRHFVVDQFDFQPELPPGWELLGAELVVATGLNRQSGDSGVATGTPEL
jgi:hypothetical protein